METLGKQIGIIETNFRTTLDTGEKVQLNVKFDFTNASDEEIISWVVANRRIAFQTPLRALTLGEAKSLNGRTILATSCGKKIESKEQQVKKLVALGVPKNVARLVVENPSKAAELLNG